VKVHDQNYKKGVKNGTFIRILPLFTPLNQKINYSMSITNNNAVAKVAAAVAGAGLVLSSFAFVAPAQADTQTDLQNQINALLAQIASLQAQLGGTTTTGAQFTRDLTIGSTGADVTELQTWLISKGYSIPAGATGYFGVQTQAALAAFQAANGITPAAGYFGPITRAKVNAMLAGGGSTGTTGGGTLSGGEATLSGYDLTTGDTVAEGDTNREIATAKFDVRGGDINVGRVRVEVQESSSNSASNDPWLYFDRMYVYDGSTKVGSVDVGSRDAWDSDNDDSDHSGSGDIFTVDIPTSDVVKEGDSAELSIRVDAQNTIDSDNIDQVFNFDIPDQGIRATDAAGIQQYEGDTSNVVSVDFNGSNAGRLSLSESSDDPDAGVLVADDNESTDNLTVFKFDLKNTEDGNALLDTINIQVATTTGTTTPLITSIIRKATLTIDGNDYDATVHGSGGSDLAGYLEFDLSNDDVVVDANSTSEATLTIDLASQSGHYSATGTTLLFSLDNGDVTAEGEDTGDDTTVVGSASGNLQTIALNGGASVAGGDMSAEQENAGGNTPDNYGVFTLKFDITAVGDDIYVPKFIASTTAASTTNGVTLDENLQTSVTGTSTESLSTSADVDSSNSQFYVVHGGTSEEFTAQAVINPTTAQTYQVGLDSIRFTTNADGSSLQSLDVNELDSQFHTDQLYINYP
jgi:hypothetical protein